MTVEKAIEKPIEGGFGWKSVDFTPAIFLDKNFWRSLGKALGWEKKVVPMWDTDAQTVEIEMNEWEWHWHRFIDYLADGKTTQEFFASL